MTLVVTITNDLEGWVEDSEAEAMSDADIIALVKEDLTSFCDGANFTVTREEGNE